MKTVLIIDDHTDLRENTAEILSLGGYHAITAENGKKGVELALKEKPAIIVCDVMMPELDGFGVLHLLRKNPETENIPFIFLTAKTERSDFRKGMEMGADDFITKPFDDLELLNAIEMRLKKYAVLEGSNATDEGGVNNLTKGLKASGLLEMDFAGYESEIFSRKQLVYTDNKRPRYLYYLKSGKIKTYKQNEDGKEYITHIFSEGDFLGYLALLENRNYDDNAEVLEEAELAMIPKDDFITAVTSDLGVASKFIKLISRNVKDQEQRLLGLAYDSLRKRIAQALININVKFNGGEDTSPLDISRDDIAQYVGTATESLIRTLSDFKSEQLIEIKEGKIRILNIEKLSKLLH
ncbi:MAG: response regulator [Chitinophagaceae bacterium]|nr:response regulator [Chitinophagaceae bacterium]